MLKSFDEAIEKVKKVGPYTLSVAGAEDEELLKAVKKAVDMGFIKPILVGNEGKIKEIIKKVKLDNCKVINSSTSEEAALEAVKLVKKGKAQVLMKGLVNTSVYMRAVLNRQHGLRTGRLISLMAVYELPGYHKLLYCTDSGINTAPNLKQKKDILINALKAMKRMGLNNPKVAALAANEMVDEKVQATVDAAELVKMRRNNEISKCIIEGPIAFDVAFDKNAAQHKGIDSQISGDVDLLLFPNIETGNVLGKSWLHFNKAKWVGIVLGASNPVILGSRSDTAEIKINSIALGCLASSQI
ncbi:bifunctional enoyl-CoA hydratase/phosphate acetyltransferase [Maledivibacter halophilus]|uniref:Phosphate butyryltransferase n=1 Tax=Maledivibacter halophilus TaxID=36842 RepID=A0A1T5ME49_9FIRM|nr:bifunctional enoyl-CoA hydratase/phosphate acetyltransferase [Maledivibacter halophilus]SKC86363.1 phosphate butyryltransferase [Maledivibacter halophilus]